MTNPTRTPGRYGRRAPSNRPAVRFADIRTGAVIPAHPATEDYLSHLSNWAMLGNDTAADCVAVTWANMRRLITSTLSTEDYPSQAETWLVYQTQNPTFNPIGDPNVNGPGSSADNGMDIQTLLEYLVKNGGPDGAKAIAFAKVDFTNQDEFEAALAIFGGVWVGVNVSQENQTEFANGQPWDAVGTVEGGHSVLAGGYTPDVRFITWAAETEFTPAFVQQRMEEAWVVVWPEHLGTAQFEAGVDVPALEAAFTDLTGSAVDWPPSPSPAPTPPVPSPTPEPTPQPTPAPSPAPQPTPADQAFAAILRKDGWVDQHHIGDNHHVAVAAKVWLEAVGL